MRIVLTGSSGRVGRAIFNALSISGEHDVLGIDRSPFSTTRFVGDFSNEKLLASSLEGADAVVHTAALHAPHVGMVPDEEFYRINAAGTELIAKAAIAAGVTRLVFTSTTALYGHAVSPGSCSWIDEETIARPKSIYHRTKLEAERRLEDIARSQLAVRVLRMSRSFPEPADIMAMYRLHRGVDIRDVADAHVMALTNGGVQFQRHIISATTPFVAEDCEALAGEASSVIQLRAPALALEFDRRGWTLPKSIDRIYQSARAVRELGWRPRFGFDEVLAQLERQSLEVMPPGSHINRRSE